MFSGGIRQRLGLNAPRPNPDASADGGGRARKKTKTIGGFLQNMFLAGRLSGPEVQEGCQAAESSHCRDEVVSDLVSAGASGAHRGNVHRDLLSKMGKRSNSTQVYSRRAPFWNTETHEQYYDDMYFNLIHEKLDDVVSNTSVDEWTSVDEGSGTKHLIDEWKTNVGLNGNQLEVDEQPIAALGLWGDSATYFTRDQLVVMLFNVLSGVHHTRFLICAMGQRTMCNCGCKGRCTMEAVWSVIAWSMQALVAKVWPTHRDDGVPFSEWKKIGDAARANTGAKKQKLRLRAGVIEKRGDWSWLKHILNLTGWKAEGFLGNMCYKCGANCTTLPWTDFSLAALWRSALFCHRAHQRRILASDSYMCGIYNLPGFQLKYVNADMMHCICLGILQYFLANVLLELFLFMGGLVTQPEATLAELMLFIKMASKQLGQDRPPINRLTFGMIKGDGPKQPKLKTKAAEGRRLLPSIFTYSSIFSRRRMSLNRFG